jgi:predicted RNA-binding Zn-ribbon protein involved in translation (DUF1610 family)
MPDEPKPLRGEWLHPAAGHHSYPPRHSRYPGPRRACPHCGLVSETGAHDCPVCGAAFARSLISRLLARMRA